MSKKRRPKPNATKDEGVSMSEASTTDKVVDAAQGAVASAAETVQQTASAVVDTAQQATSAVTGAISDTVGQATDAAAGRVEQVADTLAQTADNQELSEGTRQVAATTVNVLDRTSEYLRNGDVSLVVDDFRSVVRHHPLRSLVVGVGLGYLARSIFFPAAPKPAAPSRQPYMPTFQEVPVYRESTYGAASATSAVDYGFASSGAATLGTVTPAPDNDYTGDVVSIEDDFTTFDSPGIGPDLSASLDMPTMLNDASAGDMLALGDDTAAMRSDSGSMDDFAGITGDLGDTASVGGDNELLRGDETYGAASLDTTIVDASYTTDESLNAQDDAAGSDADTTLPSDDVLRAWDDSTSSSGHGS